MHIIHIASELAPVAKIGGLGDVLYGLSKELVRKGHKVEVLLPKFDCIDYTQLKQLKVELRDIVCMEGGKPIHNTLWSCQLENLRVLLLEAHHHKPYFDCGKIYGADNDVERFTYFCSAALQALLQAQIFPDVLHLHDWPAALCAPLYKEVYEPLGLKIGGTMLTIHNLEYQGKCAPKQIARLGLDLENPKLHAHLQDPVSAGKLNPFKAGLEYADLITAVSPTYAREILTKELGMGLDEVLHRNRHKLHGILNGIDEDFWNPQKDPLLIKQYATHGVTTHAQLQKTLAGKAENRRHIRTHFNLKEENAPLVASITRLVPQKGPTLLLHALKETLKANVQFVMLASDHGSALEKEFLHFHGKEKRVGICIDRDEALAHLIFAAADILLIPSRFEPCGLTQLIALRYGTVPIVRRTGGLADTIFDIDTADCVEEERNGFSFDFFDAEGMDWALHRALACYVNDRAKWERLMLNGMRQDFSWERPAAAYIELYTSLAAKEKVA